MKKYGEKGRTGTMSCRAASPLKFITERKGEDPYTHRPVNYLQCDVVSLALRRGGASVFPASGVRGSPGNEGFRVGGAFLAIGFADEQAPGQQLGSVDDGYYSVPWQELCLWCLVKERQIQATKDSSMCCLLTSYVTSHVKRPSHCGYPITDAEARSSRSCSLVDQTAKGADPPMRNQ